MSKELVIASSAHETRVAILEDGQPCEIYIEREKEYALVGSIYKGRVTRVLPGMQSAFVDIGLDTDAFLYVSDVLEDLEEYDHIAPGGESHPRPEIAPASPVRSQDSGGAPVSESRWESTGVPQTGTHRTPETASPPATEEPLAPAAPAEPPAAPPRPPSASPRMESRGRFDRRGGRFGRRRGRRGGSRDLPASKYVSSSEPAPSEPEAGTGYGPVILPGESLAKYKDRAPTPPEPQPETFGGAGLSPRDAEPESHEPAASEPFEAREEVAPAFVAGPEPPEPAEERFPDRTADEPSAPPTEFQERGFAPPEPGVAERAAPDAATSPIEDEPRAESARPGSLWLAPEETAAPATRSEPAASEGTDELTFEESAAITETLAEERQQVVLEAEPEAESGNGEPSEPNGEAAEPEPQEGNASIESAEPDDSSGPGNEVATVRMDRPASSRFERPMPRDRHRGGRRHHHQRGERDRHRERSRYQAPPRRTQQISDLLKAGQEVIIQITKEPLGKKGARITSHVALPGRFLVYMPTLDHVGISRKIGTGETRARLRRLVESVRQGQPGGFIVRTAAGSAGDDDIRADAEYLTRTWQEIRVKGEQRHAPTLLHRDLNLVERLLRDCLNRDFSAVWVDSEEEYARVVDFVSRFQPDLVSRVKLYSKETPIFEEMGVQQEIDKSLRPKVWLKSGGYIVINHTEALVAIDVNTGKYVGRGSTRLEDTIVKTNIDAVKEIVRQIRLRDLGGIIVVDFIDMEERRNRDKVLQALEEALRQDRAPSKVLPFNEFGLVAITRKRTKQALERVLCQPCPYCSGSGMVKSVPTICYEIETESRKMAGELDSPSLTLRVHPEIAKALKTREAHLLDELERATHKNVVIQSDATLHFEQYDIF